MQHAGLRLSHPVNTSDNRFGVVHDKPAIPGCRRRQCRGSELIGEFRRSCDSTLTRTNRAGSTAGHCQSVGDVAALLLVPLLSAACSVQWGLCIRGTKHTSPVRDCTKAHTLKWYLFQAGTRR